MSNIDPGYVEMAAQNAKEIKSANRFRQALWEFLKEGKAEISEIDIGYYSSKGNRCAPFDQIKLTNCENDYLTALGQQILQMLDKYIDMHKAEMKDTLTMAMTGEES